MNVVKLGTNGRVSIPKSVLESLHLEGGQWWMVDTTPDGAIVLRPASVGPIEMYDDARIEDFLAEDRLPSSLEERLRSKIDAS
jgi:AbrB family looped-hinge helix DNA binding protein